MATIKELVSNKKPTANILGINISLDDKNTINKKITDFLFGDKSHYIVTPNPEIILSAQNDKIYKNILNNAAIAIADGFGIKLAGFTYKLNIPRITGADLLNDLLRIANEKKQKIAILNWEKSLSNKEAIAGSIQNYYPALNFKIFTSKRKVDDRTINNIIAYGPKIIIVTLGAPFQEKFIFDNLHMFTSARLAIGVGGAFDFFTGRIKRAPKLLRFIGLEWLYRIFQEKGPRKLWRLKRIYNAVIIFSFKFIIWRLKNNAKKI